MQIYYVEESKTYVIIRLSIFFKSIIYLQKVYLNYNIFQVNKIVVAIYV
jgi:hypothetical protein